MGSQQRKRIPSIAISSHTANSPVSRYPFSSFQNLKDAHAPSTSKPHICSIVSLFRHRIPRASRTTLALPSAAALGKGTATTSTPREQRAIKVFNTAKQSPLQLNAFLTRMPKGADLHMHLSGAIYAETFIKDAAADLLCVDP